MPDPLKQSLSATQTPALFGASPYVTRWMLLRHFIHGDAIDSPEHNRMNWGLRMQPLLLQQAAEDLHLEVRLDEQYVRRGLLGCTRDAVITCPDRGPGALECKCVFDYGVWMRDWNGGKTPPRHYEIQLQQQMMVGDPEFAEVGKIGPQYQWGVLAAWVCGEMHYFERKPIPELWKEIEHEAVRFFDDVKAKQEGEPFGDPIEVPLLARLFAPKPGLKIDLTTRADADDLVCAAQMLNYHADESNAHKKQAEKFKAKLRAVMGDAEEGILPHGVKIKAKQQSRAGYTVKPTTFTIIDVFIPSSAPPVQTEQKQPDNVLAGG